jgi:hypothetical protein
VIGRDGGQLTHPLAPLVLVLEIKGGRVEEMASSMEKRGCLSVLFPFLRPKTKSEDRFDNVFPYRLRDDFLSPAELSFYKVLSSVLGERFVVQSKVRLADIFFVAHPKEKMVHFNRISQRHLDFLICDARTMEPLLGIELDDASHRRSARRERDEFVEKVFQSAKLPLLRYPVQTTYSTKEIIERMRPVLKAQVVKNRVQAEEKPDDNLKVSAPLCPKCGIPMVLRTATRGKHRGMQFYGCVNYPQCREVKPVSNGKMVG